MWASSGRDNVRPRVSNTLGQYPWPRCCPGNWSSSHGFALPTVCEESLTFKDRRILDKIVATDRCRARKFFIDAKYISTLKLYYGFVFVRVGNLPQWLGQVVRSLLWPFVLVGLSHKTQCRPKSLHKLKAGDGQKQKQRLCYVNLICKIETIR